MVEAEKAKEREKEVAKAVGNNLQASSRPLAGITTQLPICQGKDTNARTLMIPLVENHMSIPTYLDEERGLPQHEDTKGDEPSRSGMGKPR